MFVLPNKNRIASSTNLLDTAKLLMGCTPNGVSALIEPSR